MGEPTAEEFLEFYKTYEEACRKRDGEFFRKILPSDIPQDEFNFVLTISQQSAQAIDRSGVKPKVVQNGNKFEAVYEGDLGDGMTNLAVDFYYSDGAWLKYNPEV